MVPEAAVLPTKPAWWYKISLRGQEGLSPRASQMSRQGFPETQGHRTFHKVVISSPIMGPGGQNRRLPSKIAQD